MLIAVVLTFVVVELPQGLVLFICSINSWYFDHVYRYLGDVIDVAVLLNSSVNFILYATMSRKFRKTFYEKLIHPVMKHITISDKKVDLQNYSELQKLNGSSRSTKQFHENGQHGE